MDRPRHRAALARSLALAACVLASLAPAAPSLAQAETPIPTPAPTPAPTPTWPEVKCSLYRQAWTQALARLGTHGLSRGFIASHEAFVASGCTTQGHVCPRSAEEFDLANVMTIQAMNAGTASTFLPFACPRGG